MDLDGKKLRLRLGAMATVTIPSGVEHRKTTKLHVLVGAFLFKDTESILFTPRTLAKSVTHYTSRSYGSNSFPRPRRCRETKCPLALYEAKSISFCTQTSNTMDLQNITFYSVPVGNVQRHVVFSLNDIFPTLRDLQLSWNNPAIGHVIMMSMGENDQIWLSNQCNEDMVLCAYSNAIQGSFFIGHFAAMEMKMVNAEAFWSGVPSDIYVVFNDTPAFDITAYLHRKKVGLHYARKETVTLRQGVYFGIGNVAASLNDSVQMRGERNGFIYHFISKKGKLCIESSHRQPDPSFLEIIPRITSLGLTEDCTLRLRTKERLDFDYGACVIIC